VSPIRLLAFLCLFSLCFSFSLVAQAQETAHASKAPSRAESALAQLDAVLAQLPAKDSAAQLKALTELSALPHTAYFELTRQLEDPKNQVARFALEGLSFHSMRPGANPNEAAKLEKALTEAFHNCSEATKPFVLKLYARVGSEKASSPLANYLSNPELSDHAVRAMVNIAARYPDSDRALKTLLNALQIPMSEECKTAIIYGIADLGRSNLLAAGNALAAYLETCPDSLKPHVKRAMAATGSMQNRDYFNRLLKVDPSPHDLNLAAGFAEALLANESTYAAGELAKTIYEGFTGPEHSAIQSRALKTQYLATQDPELLVQATAGKSAYVRGAAVRLLREAGDSAIPAISKSIWNGSFEQQVALLTALKGADDTEAMAAFARAMKNEETSIRHAALASLPHNNLTAFGLIASVLAKGPDEDRPAAMRALDGKKVNGAGGMLAGRINDADVAGKKSLLKALEAFATERELPVLFSAMNEPDTGVRAAAASTIKRRTTAENAMSVFDLLCSLEDKGDRRRLQSAVVSGLQEIDDPKPQADALMAKVTDADEQDSFDALSIVSALSSSIAIPHLAPVSIDEARPELADHATRLLAKSKDANAMAPLLAVIQARKHPMASQAYARLATDHLSPNARGNTLQTAVESVHADNKALLEKALQPPVFDLAKIEDWEPLMGPNDLSKWNGATDKVTWDGDAFTYAPGAGHFHTKKTYSDFVLQFEFKLPPGGNNGMGIRVDGKNAAYDGMEIQILDDTHPKYKDLKVHQFHGSIYGVAASTRGHLKPVGEWNQQSIIAIGDHINVILNGHVINDVYLSDIDKTVDGKKHPGLHNESGDMVICGHGDPVSFRKIRIKDYSLPPPIHNSELNQPPKGFTAVFNGKNLNNFSGLVGNPKTRANMTPTELADAQAKADERAKKHWVPKDGILVFDGKGQNLCTKEVGDFDFYVDWKIGPDGDSGLYLRGSPQVQMWDPSNEAQFKHGNQKGSGGLWNNKIHPRDPLVKADNPIGEWNTFLVRMVGERVTIFLNGKKVVNQTVLENYWENKKPIYRRGSIELQNHGNPLYFRNIYLRELPY